MSATSLGFASNLFMPSTVLLTNQMGETNQVCLGLSGLRRKPTKDNLAESRSFIIHIVCIVCWVKTSTGSISSSGCPITSHPSQTQPTNAVICVATLLLNKTLQKAQPIQRLCAFTKIAVFKSCHNLVKFQLDQPKKSMDRFEVLCILSTCPTNI